MSLYRKLPSLKPITIIIPTGFWYIFLAALPWGKADPVAGTSYLMLLSLKTSNERKATSEEEAGGLGWLRIQ